jgi:hypothetical protein
MENKNVEEEARSEIEKAIEAKMTDVLPGGVLKERERRRLRMVKEAYHKRTKYKGKEINNMMKK